MARANVFVNSFNTGEVSPLIHDRADLAKYGSACKTLQNAFPLVEGGAQKMPGTYFAGATSLGGAMFTGSIAGTVLTVTAINYGVIQPGQNISGIGVLAGTQIVPTAFTGAISGTTLTVSAITSGVLAVGQSLAGIGISPNTVITALETGTGGIGTYSVNNSQSITSESMTSANGGTGTYIVNNSQTVPSEQMQTASTGMSRLVPFQFSTNQGAILEFSAGLIRIWEPTTPGQWPLGLALNPATQTNYNPATAYTPGNQLLVGPFWACGYYNVAGTLYIAAPYGSSIPSPLPITFSTNGSDALSVTITGASPNQGINIALANTTPANNAASAIEAAIQSLVSLNAGTSNYISLAGWTVTPDSIYYATPWIVAPPSSKNVRVGTRIYILFLVNLVNENWIAECLSANQNDEFPLIFANTPGSGGTSWNTTYWELASSVGEPIELSTPYLEADLFNLDCSTQSADILWIFHPNYPPAVVERQAANQWNYSLSLPNQEPGEPAYRGTTDVVKTGYSALGQCISLISQANPCVILLASAAASQPFNDGDRIYINECAGMAELNEGEFLVSGMTYGSVTVTVIDSSGTSSSVTGTGWYFTPQDPNTGANIDASGFLQYEGGGFAAPVVALFAAPGDYPACGTLYEERLCVGGSLNNPTQMNGSVQDDYPDFICDPNEDDYAIQFTLVSNKLDQLLSMIGTPNALVLGTAGGIWIMAGESGGALTQTSVDAAKQTSLGVSNLQPQLVGSAAIFVSRSARIVLFVVYDFVSNQWNGYDITRLNRNITIGPTEAQSGITQTAIQNEPYPIYWATRADGQLIGLVFNQQDQISAWFRINMLPQGGIVESVAVISGQNEEDQVVLVVNRTINGVTQRYVEYFMPQQLFGQLSNAFFVHCGQQWQGTGPFNITGIQNSNPCLVNAPGHNFTNGMLVQIANVQGMTQVNQDQTQAYTVTSVGLNSFALQGVDSTAWGVYTGGGTVKQVTNQVSGMSYLLGQQVVAVGDGALILPLDPPISVMADTVNFPYYSNLITIGIPYQTIIEPMNPILGSREATSRGKRQKISRVALSLYQSMGGLFGSDQQHLYAINYGTGSETQAPSMFTGLIERDLDGDWDDYASISIVHGEPFPFTLRSVTPILDVTGP